MTYPQSTIDRVGDKLHELSCSSPLSQSEKTFALDLADRMNLTGMRWMKAALGDGTVREEKGTEVLRLAIVLLVRGFREHDQSGGK